MIEYLKETALLNYTESNVFELIKQKAWRKLSDKDKILSAYNYIRDGIDFGYNICDAIPASQILTDGYGQCNTKSILFMAILRALDIPCRIHGFMVDKSMQKGAVTGITYMFAPKEIVHSWVEVYYQEQWYNLEGFILDMPYLESLQTKFSECTGSFCGYGVATPDFENPPIQWNENDTYIQRDAITKDLGVFASPDELFALHRQQLSAFKMFVFRNISRHVMNRNVKKIREASYRK